ncbi:MAG: hypothetical protein Q8941_14250 [Bacteroidota bacterium]|nr:hypothetical protein [Bacteroidota bacterium]
MFRHILSLILLLSHVNFFMFIAQVDEVDAYDANGCRINDINSLVEYVHDVILHQKGKPRPDEDDDNARYYHLVKAFDSSFSQQVIASEHNPVNPKDKDRFPGLSTGQPDPVFYDVVTPPPEPISKARLLL